MSRNIPPPPTKFGSGGIQAKITDTKSRGAPPPPTKFHAVPRGTTGIAQQRLAPVMRTPAVSAPIRASAGGDTIQRMLMSSVDTWPDTISVGGKTLSLNSNKTFVLYENEVHSGHSGSVHVSIHGVSPTSRRSQWDPAANPLHGRIYLTKTKQFGAEATRDGTSAHGHAPNTTEEQGAQDLIIRIAREACSYLRPFNLSADSHMLRTTMHPYSISLYKGEF